MPAHVQTKSKTQAAGASINHVATLTAGNTVIVTVVSFFSAATHTQGAGGDTLTKRAERLSSTGGLMVTQWSNFNVAGGSTTYTFNFDVSAEHSAIYITEFDTTGAGAINAFDANNVAADDTTSQTHDTGNVTTSTADAVLVAAYHGDGNGILSALTVNNSFIIPTEGDRATDATSNQVSAIAYRIITGGTGTFNTVFSDTVDAALEGLAIISAFTVVAAGGPTLTQGVESHPFKNRGIAKPVAAGVYF